jgi:hypothetical protein
VRLRQILRNQIAGALVDLLLFADDPYPFPATRAGWLEDVHVFEIVQLPFVAPPLVVFGEDVGRRAYFEVSTVPPPLPLSIPPQVTFVPNVPSPSEMINLLKRIHVLKLARPYQPSPQAVPSTAIAKSEACDFKSIDNAIVCVSRIIDPEC